MTESEAILYVEVLLRSPKDLNRSWLEGRTKAKYFGSSRRTCKKRKSIDSPLVAEKVKEVTEQEDTNVEEGRIHIDEYQHEHETRLKTISAQDLNEFIKALQEITPRTRIDA